MDNTLELVRTMLQIIRPLMHRSFSADSCIAASRIGIDVLREFGIKAVPVPVRVAIFNAAMMQLVDHHGRFPTCRKETERWAAEHGAWSVGIGSGIPRAGRWPGHLVIHVPTLGCIVDLSLDQASRPEHGITLGPIAFPSTPEFLAGTSQLALEYNNCLLSYEPIRDLGYRQSPNWLHDRPVIEVTQQAIAILRGTMAPSLMSSGSAFTAGIVDAEKAS